LREEQVIWVITVGRDGTPQPDHVSFLLQDDDSSHPRRRPAPGGSAFRWRRRRGDIVVFTGTVSLPDDTPPPHENPAYLATYGDSLLKARSSVEEFGKKFPVSLLIEITRIRGR
jgi:hypothetical protein